MSESVLVTTAQLIVVGAAVFVAAFVQIVAGFGFALLAVPLMTLAIEPKIAVVVSSLTAIFVTSWQAYRSRHEADKLLVRRMTTAAYLGMPLGLIVFLNVNDDALRFLLGVAVLIAVVMLALRVNLHHAGPRLDYGVGFLSGVLATSLSTNGPPLVFALQARQLSAVTFRATISTVFALCNIGGLALFIASGKITRDGLVTAAITVPAMFAGQLLGFPIRRHVHGERFRRLVLALLVAAAVERDRRTRWCDEGTKPMILAGVATTILAIANWYSRWKANARIELISKPLTTVGAIAIAASAGGPGSATIFAIVALVLCLVGDVALMTVVDRFVLGLAAFLLGHVAFMIMFAVRGFDRWPLAGVALIGCAVLIGTAGGPIIRGASAKGLGIPVRAYLTVISTMCVLGWATGNWLIIVGATAFIVSDSILGWGQFVAERRWMDVAIMVTYHVAIVALALSLAV